MDSCHWTAQAALLFDHFSATSMQTFAKNIEALATPLYPAYIIAKLRIENSSPDIAYVEFG